MEFKHKLKPPDDDIFSRFLYSSEILNRGGISDANLDLELYVPLMTPNTPFLKKRMTIRECISFSSYYNDVISWCKNLSSSYEIISETIEEYQNRLLLTGKSTIEPSSRHEIIKFFDGYGVLYHPYSAFITFENYEDYFHFILRWE